MIRSSGDTHREDDISLSVDYQGTDDVLDDLDEALATGRTFFATDRWHPAGTRVHLTMRVPGLRHPIAMDGAVIGDGAVVSDGGIVIDTVYDGGIDSLIETDTRRDAPVPGIVIELSRGSRRWLAALISRIRAQDPTLVRPVVRLLLVEDNQHVADLLRGGLRKGDDDLAYVVHATTDGAAALDLLRTDPWDVAIVDMYLPVVDGAELIRRARADPALRDRPIIAVSAGGQAARRAALEAGATAFLDKPVRLRQVVETVRQQCIR